MKVRTEMWDRTHTQTGKFWSKSMLAMIYLLPTPKLTVTERTELFPGLTGVVEREWCFFLKIKIKAHRHTTV